LFIVIFESIKLCLYESSYLPGAKGILESFFDSYHYFVDNLDTIYPEKSPEKPIFSPTEPIP